MFPFNPSRFLFFNKMKAIGLGLCLLWLSLLGCWKPQQGKEVLSNSFSVVSVDGDADTPRKLNDEDWRLPTHREIFIRVCVKDKVLNAPLQGKYFSVEIPEDNNKLINPAATDSTGCFQWQEKMAYNYLAPRPAYIQVRRRLYGRGLITGFIDIQLAISPWAKQRGDNKKGVIYLKAGQVSETQMAKESEREDVLSGKYGGLKPKLWIQDFKPTIVWKDDRTDYVFKNNSQQDKKDPTMDPKDFNLKEDGALLRIFMSMTPKVEVEDFEGNPYYIFPKKGEFEISAQLLSSHLRDEEGNVIQEESLLLTPYMIPSRAHIMGTNLETGVYVGLTRRMTRATLELVLRVVPKDLSLEVKPFEAPYILGDIQKILGSSTASLNPDFFEMKKNNFSYDQYLAKASNFKELEKAQRVMKFQPFIYDWADVKFTGISPGETATQRTVEYQVITCVRDTLTDGKVKFLQDFHVFDDQGRELKLTTDLVNGCLIWTSSLTHKYYKPEEYFFPKFTIRYRGSSFTIELALNPWDTQFRTFGRDTREFTAEYVQSLKDRQKIPSYLLVNRYEYQALSFHYEIDRFLDLQVKKEILLTLKPQVIRYSNILTGRKVQTESLRDGIYLMKVAIHKHYFDAMDRGLRLQAGPAMQQQEGGPFIPSTQYVFEPGYPAIVPKDFVTVVKRLVRVSAGEINANVIFSVNDLRLMRVRSALLIQLEPVDEQRLQVANALDKLDPHDLEGLSDQLQAAQQDRALKKKNSSQWDEQAETKRIQVQKLVKEMFSPKKDGQVSGRALSDEFGFVPFQLDRQFAEKLKNTLWLNDFTKTEIAPTVDDLDTLIDPDSGLQARTFLGPVMFLSNSSSGSMRPTDNLDLACFKREIPDCDEFKRRELSDEDKSEANKATQRAQKATQKFIGLLGNKTVDELIKLKTMNESQHQKMMPKLSSLTSFVHHSGYLFGTLNPKNCDPIDQELCQSSQQKHVMEVLNRTGGLSSSMKEDWDLLWGKGILSRQLTALFYEILAQGISDRLKSKSGRPSPMREQEAKFLFRSYVEPYFAPLFSVHRKLKVYEIDRDQDKILFHGGRQMNFNVSANFSFNSSESSSFGLGGSLTDLITKGFDGLKSGVAGFLNLSIKFGEKNKSKSDGTTISEQTYLAAQIATLQVHLKKYERCLVIAFTPDVQKRILDISPTIWSVQSLNIPLGLLLCTGEMEYDRDIIENYFYFSQNFTMEGDLLDGGDLLNNPWLLPLRGSQDFYKFATYLRRDDNFSLYNGRPVVQDVAWPLDQLSETYRFTEPSFPGFYSILDAEDPLQNLPLTQPGVVVPSAESSH